MRSVQRSMCAAMLTLQAITLGLTTPVLISVAEVPVARGLAIGLGLAAACLVTAGLLRHRWAFAVGWVIQVASIALFVLVPLMLVLGIIFAALWGGAYFLGERIDRERAEREQVEADRAPEHQAPEHPGPQDPPPGGEGNGR